MDAQSTIVIILQSSSGVSFGWHAEATPQKLAGYRKDQVVLIDVLPKKYTLVSTTVYMNVAS
jgi:hypothetical protein